MPVDHRAVADLTGFEPAIFSVTGRRGQPLPYRSKMAGSAGFAPTSPNLEFGRLLLSYEPEHLAGVAPAPRPWEGRVLLLDERCNECFWCG